MQSVAMLSSKHSQEACDFVIRFQKEKVKIEILLLSSTDKQISRLILDKLKKYGQNRTLMCDQLHNREYKKRKYRLPPLSIYKSSSADFKNKSQVA